MRSREEIAARKIEIAKRSIDFVDGLLAEEFTQWEIVQAVGNALYTKSSDRQAHNDLAGCFTAFGATIPTLEAGALPLEAKRDE